MLQLRHSLQTENDIQSPPLIVRPLVNKGFGRENLATQLWRMNIMCIDTQRNHIYVACGNIIKAFAYQDYYLESSATKFHTIQLYHGDPDATINQLRIDRDLMIAVTMGGFVYLFDLRDIMLRPVVLNNLYENIDDCSTWSVDTYQINGCSYLAVGSNSRIITIWNISKLDILLINANHATQQQLTNYTTTLNCEYKLISDAGDIFPNRYQIHGCTNNIPCIQFSPCGTMIAAVTIDKWLRVFSVEQGTQLYCVETHLQGWGVVWIGKQDVQLEIKEDDFPYLLGFSGPNQLCVFDVQSNKFKQLYKSREVARIQRLRLGILRFSKELQAIVAVAQNMDQVYLYGFLVLDGKLSAMSCQDIQFQNQIVLGAEIFLLKGSERPTMLMAVLGYQGGFLTYEIESTKPFDCGHKLPSTY